MKYNSPHSFFFKFAFGVVVCLFFGFSGLSQTLNINTNTTISAVDPPEEVDNVIYNNSSKLTITGTLIVNGDFDMDRNDASLELGAGARLIVYGDFIAANKVNITLSQDSYFFVYGNFSKGGSSNQDVVIIDNAKIYILGNGDNWGNNITSCGGGYEGTTSNVNDTCDFGNEDDFENNQDEFPDDLVEQLNCYDLSKISSKEAWEGGEASFEIDAIPNVDYQWQLKPVGASSWINVGQNSPILNLSNLSLDDSGNQYRVKVVPTTVADCKISISKNVDLKVSSIPQIENESPEIVCSGELIEFKIEENSNYNYSWYRTDSGGNNFFPINDGRYSGSNTATMIINAESWMNNQNFKVEVTGPQGNIAFSNIVNFQVNQSPQGINTQPSNQVVCEGNDISFQTYTSNDQRQWQVSEDSGSTWSNLSNNEIYQNVSSERLDIINVPLNFNNNLYRIKISNQSCSVYSNPASLQVDPAPITQQPQDAFAEFGGDAIIETTVSGENLSFQWQTFSSNWYNIDDNQNYRGTRTQSLELLNVGYFPVDGSRYRLLVTNQNGCVAISEEAFLNIGQDPCENQNTWTGAEDTNWNNTANWSCNALPTLETDVLIPSGLMNYPVVNSGNNGLAKNLEIENAASVEVLDNWLQIAGAIANAGDFITIEGSIALVGENEQIIPSGTFTNNRIENLLIDNTSGVISEGNIELTGILKVETGDFDTGDDLFLISDENQTGLIDGSGSGEVQGLVHMQRYLDEAYGYKYFSSPFQNAVVADFAPYIDLTADFPNFYRYNENRRDSLDNDATGWEIYTDGSSTLNQLEGYAANFGDTFAPVTVEITGLVNNGPVSINLENHNREYTKGFQLVGNPYPSPIDWNANGWTKQNIDDGIYFFTASDTSQYTGTYTSFVGNVSSDGRSTAIIPSMQGFFVKVSDPVASEIVSGVLGVTNEVRVTDFDQQFLKTAIQAPGLIRLNAQFKGAGNPDAMVVYFDESASNGFEKDLDAHKLMNTDIEVPNLYSLSSDNNELSINAISLPTKENQMIPLGIKTERAGEMSIYLSDIENLPGDFPVYLKDKKNNRFHNLRENPEYTFNAEKGIDNSRFELWFTEVIELSASEKADELFSVTAKDGFVIVQLNLENGSAGLLYASTVTGQIVQTKEGREKEEVEFSAITSSGVYFISLDYQGKRYSKKVLIKK